MTAFITSYAAINRNSPKADEVFRFFELLFSDEAPEPAHEGQEQKPSGPHWGRLIGCVLLVAAIAFTQLRLTRQKEVDN